MDDKRQSYGEEVKESKARSLSDEDRALIKKAEQEADDRYLANYKRNYKRRYGRKKVSRSVRFLTGSYLLMLAAFTASLIYLNMFPKTWMLAIAVILAVVTAAVVMGLRSRGRKKGTRILAALLALLLIFFYGVGTVYTFTTMSFLSATSAENEKPVESVEDDTFHVVITGIDTEGVIDEPGRSDVNMVLTVNPRTHQLLMTSIPRDYQISLAEHGGALDKLTHTGYYGVESTMAAEGSLLDIEPNYYVKVNFTTVRKFIDAIGGIDVYSEYEFSPTNDWTVHVGTNHMNGEQALAFSRTRYAFEEGDRQRIRNQQAVFEAIFRKAVSSPSMIINYSSILSELQDYFKMSFSPKEIRELVRKQLADNQEWRIYKSTITGGDAMMPTYSGGSQNLYVMTRDEKSLANARARIIAVMKGEEPEMHVNSKG
ncbi:MAG: LCP family protein [Mogibacterium sp.]|nr:LCP family protein [Mogibacterium sp.]